MRFKIEAEIDVPDTSGIGDDEGAGYTPNLRTTREYVKSALTYWGGQFHPSDPYFSAGLKVGAVKVRRAP